MNKEQRQQDLNDMFIMAADRECIDVCEYLLSLGADVNAKKGFEGDTPLHWAACFEKLDMCKFLLDNGADMHMKNNWGITPLDKIENKNTKIYKLFKKYFKD